MIVDDTGWASAKLQQINYYRLSGYWYSFRQLRVNRPGRGDMFIRGSTLRDVIAIYDFDVRLRTAVFSALAPIELSIRALLGHELGKVDPHVHLEPHLLGATAREERSARPSKQYDRWKSRYDQEVGQSREDFVKHHQKYGGRLPVWVAVEVLDWGSLSNLYALTPVNAREAVANRVGLGAPQLGSWLRSLNIVRNYAAHHCRMFNRVYALTPRLPQGGRHPELKQLEPSMSRTFGQITLIRHLSDQLGVGNPRLLRTVLKSYPEIAILPFSHLGAPADWESYELWK